MELRLRRAGAAAAVGLCLAATLGIGAGTATGQAAPPTGQGTTVTTCANPVVDQGIGGWGRHAGGTSAPQRVTIAKHVVGAYGAWLSGNGSNPAMYLPQKTVKPGEVWTFGIDNWVANTSAAQIRMGVDWYSTTGAYLGHADGAPTAVPVGSAETWTRAAADFTVPASAARANVTATLLAPAGASWIATACDYRPKYTTTTPPTTTPPAPPPPTTTVAPPPPTTTAPPAATTTVTATTLDADRVRVDWVRTGPEPASWTAGRDGVDDFGTPPWTSPPLPASDRTFTFTSLLPGTTYTFTVTPAGGTPVTATATTAGTTPPPTTTPPPGGTGTTAAETQGWGTPAWSWEFDNLDGWGLYLSPGHEHGDRDPAQCVAVNGVLELRSLPNRKTCGMADTVHRNIEYGRYETRTRTTGSGWMALHIIWPTSERWPDDGERDWLEFPAGSSCYTGFIHYPGHTPERQYQIPNGCPAGGTGAFHNVAVEFAPGTIKSWIDGQLWYSKTCDADLCQMPGGGHLTIQNDATVGTPGTATTYVDHVRYYPLN